MELLRSEELSTSGSMRDGISASQEKEFRDEGLVLIKDLAIKVRLPQPVVATAQVYFHRVTKSFSSRSGTHSGNSSPGRWPQSACS
jgi:hypothetical protein